MALAILELLDADETKVAFRIDSGTNTQFQLKFGRAVRDDGGGDWVDDVYYTTPASQIEGHAGFSGGAQEVCVPLDKLERGRGYAQLFTCKAGDKAQAFSDVLVMPGAAFLQPQSLAGGLSLGARGAPSMRTPGAHRPPRQVANRTAPISRQASLENVLGEIVKIASPLVLDALKGLARPANGAAPPGSGTPPAAAAVPMDALAQLLQSVLGALGAPGGAPPISQPKSLGSGGNRLSRDSAATYARPFIFGIDDALIASLVGPVLQVLPQLMNAANQKRIELKKADNALMGGILTDINKRMMMDKLLEAQQAAQAQGPAAPVDPQQLQALAALISQLPAQPAAAAATAAPVAAQNSLSADVEAAHDLSAKALLAFEFPRQVEWNGTPRPVFDRTKPITLRLRFAVVTPAPKAPLARAILKVALFDPANPASRHEKVFKLKDLLANGVMECPFEPGELSHLPANSLLSVVGELRWKNARSGRETRALGSSEIVLVGKYFIKSRGAETSAERELTEMSRFRAFWNKIWEAPALDGARGGAGKPKYVWDLDVNGRYTALLTAGHDSNGVMETRVLTEADDPDRPTLAVHGRMKAGMELSLAELNKLIPLWNGPPALDAEKLEALGARTFLDGGAAEFKYRFKLKGRAGQAGMIWVVPSFKLFGVTLSRVMGADDSGLVTATSEEDVQFPLPVAARLIGLKSAA
jgi:hypothetical protein